MNKLKLFSASTVFLIPLLFLTPANAQPPLPLNCYTEDSLKNSKSVAYMGEALALKVLTVKNIEISVKQTDDPTTSSTILDASASKVPSGKPHYQWGNAAGEDQPIKKIKTPEKGYNSSVKLRIYDSECKTESSTEINVPDK